MTERQATPPLTPAQYARVGLIRGTGNIVRVLLEQMGQAFHELEMETQARNMQVAAWQVGGAVESLAGVDPMVKELEHQDMEMRMDLERLGLRCNHPECDNSLRCRHMADYSAIGSLLKEDMP